MDLNELYEDFKAKEIPCFNIKPFQTKIHYFRTEKFRLNVLSADLLQKKFFHDYAAQEMSEVWQWNGRLQRDN